MAYIIYTKIFFKNNLDWSVHSCEGNTLDYKESFKSSLFY